MLNNVIELRDLEAKKLYLTAKELEREQDKSVERVLMDIAYGDDPNASLEALRLYYSIVMASGLTIDDVERDLSLAEVISLEFEKD